MNRRSKRLRRASVTICGMVASDQIDPGEFSAWNPGIQSEIPMTYRQLETIYDLGNVTSDFQNINDLAATTGLPVEELVDFRVSRLVLHEVIVRVTADVVVMEGEKEEDLGINFRAIANCILKKYVKPCLGDIEQKFLQRQQQVQLRVDEELTKLLGDDNRPAVTRVSLVSRLLGKKNSLRKQGSFDREAREMASIARYKQAGLESVDELDAAVKRSFYRVLGSIVATRGYIGRDLHLIRDVCTKHALHYLASQDIGLRISQLVDEAIRHEGYRAIPDADKAILFSLKGASAAGKSSLRPRLRELMNELGIEANAYGTISPDIWRRLLIDYDGLGEAYKYAGRLSSKEVNVIDGKLDRYIRDKAEKRGAIPHLMVDRFRFDSFDSEKVSRVLQDTYVRHIDTMYMYFIITPPEATVERGWLRGLERGRYKAVDDFLGHCVEAYVGMPKLLFKYLGKTRPKYRFEFLDNSVPKGSFPDLVARGSEEMMQIFRIAPLIDIERFQRINELAKSPDKVHAEPGELVVSKNLHFIRQCVKRFNRIEFVDAGSERVYLEVYRGSFEVVEQDLFRENLQDETLRQALICLAPELSCE